jgi:hypothetical protein
VAVCHSYFVFRAQVRGGERSSRFFRPLTRCARSTGTTNCWWHSIFSECKIVDGPGGIVRDDVLSAASIPAWKVSHPISGWRDLFRCAVTSLPSHLLVNQVPHVSERWPLSQTAPSHRSTSSASLRLATTRLALRNCRTALRDIQRNRTRNDLRPVLVYVCATASADGAGCTFASPRTHRAYTPGVMGIQQVFAVKVDDLDNWELTSPV